MSIHTYVYISFHPAIFSYKTLTINLVFLFHNYAFVVSRMFHDDNAKSERDLPIKKKSANGMYKKHTFISTHNLNVKYSHKYKM